MHLSHTLRLFAYLSVALGSFAILGALAGIGFMALVAVMVSFTSPPDIAFTTILLMQMPLIYIGAFGGGVIGAVYIAVLICDDWQGFVDHMFYGQRFRTA